MVEKKKVRVSKSYKDFEHDLNELWSFVFFTVGAYSKIDEFTKISAKALLKVHSPGSKEWHRSKASLNRKGVMAHFSSKYRVMLLEMFLCRAVDRFLSYLSNVLVEVFRDRPEMLVSDAAISVKEIVKLGDIESILSFAIEKKINDLSYKGLRTIHDDLLRKYKLTLFPDDGTLEYFSALVAVRNLIVHNRGHVDHKFLRAFPGLNLRHNQLIPVPDGSEVLGNLLHHSLQFDLSVTNKFKIKPIRYSSLKVQRRFPPGFDELPGTFSKTKKLNKNKD